MGKDYEEIASSLSKNLGDLHKQTAETTAGFGAMAKGALQDGTLSKKHKELIDLAIGVAAKYDGCIAFHTKALVELGVSREEVGETLGMCVYMGADQFTCMRRTLLLHLTSFLKRINFKHFK